jgi:hypothetical protein
MAYDLGVIRQLLKEALTDKKFEELLFDFSSDLDEETSGQPLTDRRTALVVYANKYRQIPKLLAAIQETNPTVYEEFKDRLGIPEMSGPNSVPNTQAKPSVINDQPARLGVSEATPALVGLAVDVSGSMTESMRPSSGGEVNRLRSVLNSFRDMVRGHKAASLAKLFAFGFGFENRIANYGSLASMFLKVELPPKVGQGDVRDLLDLAGFSPSTRFLAQIGTEWEELERGLLLHKLDMAGRTPMRQCMEAMQARFRSEAESYRGMPVSFLLIVTDGESTDGDPTPPCAAMDADGVMIAGCYLNAADILNSKRLYDEPQPEWPTGAVTLFNCCSRLDEAEKLATDWLSSKGWQASPGDRLFIQANQSEHVTEFFELATRMIRR